MSCAIRSKPININIQHHLRPPRSSAALSIRIYRNLWLFICNISLVIFFSFSVLCRLVLWACLGSPLPPRPSPSLLLSGWPPSSTLLALVSHAFGLPPPGVKSNYERFMTAGQLHSMSINLATLNCVGCVFFFVSFFAGDFLLYSPLGNRKLLGGVGSAVGEGELLYLISLKTCWI